MWLPLKRKGIKDTLHPGDELPKHPTSSLRKGKSGKLVPWQAIPIRIDQRRSQCTLVKTIPVSPDPCDAAKRSLVPTVRRIGAYH